METCLNNILYLIRKNQEISKEQLFVIIVLLLADVLLNPTDHTVLKGYKYNKSTKFNKIRGSKHFLSLLDLDNQNDLIKLLVDTHNSELEKEKNI